MKKLFWILTVSVLLDLTACNNSFINSIFGSDNSKKTSEIIKKPKYIIIQPASIILAVGEEKIITSFVYMDDGSVDSTNSNILWESEDRSILDIQPSGKLRAVREGQTGISAKVKDSNISSRVIVNILKKKLVEKIVITPASLNMKRGDTSDLIAVVYMSDGTKNGNVKWFSSDNTIAQVNESGKVTAIRKGITSIVATYELDNAYKQSIDINISD